MSRTIQFFFEFSSPYSYIAAERIDALAARYGFAVDWKPMLLGVLFKTTGGAPLTMVHPWKVEYAMADFRRSAQAAGLPYAHPSKFPQSTQNAARAVLWLQATRPEAAVPFALEVFRTIFVRDGDATDPATLARIGATLDLDADAIGAAVQDPAIKQQLARNNDEAATLRIFGAPTVVVDGELFWGADRLGQLEQRLRQIAGGKSSRALVDEAMEQVATISVDQALTRLGAPGVQFVDLRDAGELERDGTIPGALHAPRGMLEFWVDPSSPYYKPEFTPDKRYVFFCGTGWRSALAGRTMHEMGLLGEIAHIDGGFDAWRASSAPIVRAASQPTVEKH